MHNKSPKQVWLTGMFLHWGTDYSAMRSAMEPTPLDIEDTDTDTEDTEATEDQEPVLPTILTSNNVQVPEIDLEYEHTFMQNVDNCVQRYLDHHRTTLPELNYTQAEQLYKTVVQRCIIEV